MRYGLLAGGLIGAAILGFCSENVLDPKGLVTAAEWLILVNSLGITPAIVMPTNLATLGVAWWFRSSNMCARYLPNFVDPRHDGAAGASPGSWRVANSALGPMW